jgi:hypothetical protein
LDGDGRAVMANASGRFFRYFHFFICRLCLLFVRRRHSMSSVHFKTFSPIFYLSYRQVSHLKKTFQSPSSRVGMKSEIDFAATNPIQFFSEFF